MIRKNAKARHAAKMVNVHGSGYARTPHNLVGSVYKITLRYNGELVGHFYDDTDANEGERLHRLSLKNA
jgi:hypothetical protein